MSFLSQMLGLLTSAYAKTDEYNVRNALPLETNIGRLFAVFDWGLGLIERSTERIRLWADIDHAEGAALDRCGKNFGVSRGGSDDVFFRLLIKIKILSQMSGGDIETLLSAVSGLYDIPADRVELYELFPSKVQIAIFEDDLPADYAEMKDLVGVLTKRLLAGGIGLDMVYKSEGSAKDSLYIGGRAASEFTRIRLENRIEEIPQIMGGLPLAGCPVTEFTRIRFGNQNL